MSIQSMIRVTGRLAGHLSPTMAARLAENLATRPRHLHRPRLKSTDLVGEWITFRYGLKARRWGKAGPVILAIHGWEGHPDQFASMGHALAGLGYRFYALAGPGHVAGTGKEADPALFASALQEVSVELGGEVAAVIGHSMGAGAALMALSDGLLTQRVVLISGAAGFRSVLERTADQLGLPSRARQRFLRRMELRTGRSLAEVEAIDALPRVQQPVLVVHDRQDRIIPFADFEQLQAKSPNAQFLATEGLGHSRILADEAVNRRIQAFLLPDR